jgi:hypothetical protein
MKTDGKKKVSGNPFCAEVFVVRKSSSRDVVQYFCMKRIDDLPVFFYVKVHVDLFLHCGTSQERKDKRENSVRLERIVSKRK